MQTELIKREVERERRDREFWRVMFGGEADGPTNGTVPMTEDELIANLARR